MRKLLYSTLLASAALIAQPASAVITFDSIGDTTGAIPFNGLINGVVQPGLTSTLTLTLASLNTTTGVFTWNYDLFNTSSAPITGSRVSAFGFNTTPNVSATGHFVTGEFDTVTLGGNVPGLGTFEVCVSDGNCAGGASGGPTIGQHGTGALTLDFADGTTAVNMDDLGFFVRYQSIVGATLPGTNPLDESGVGTVIPEPATWMSMLAGFGALGFAMRRRRNVTVSFA